MVGAALSRLIKFLETFTEHNHVIYNENYLYKLMYFFLYRYIFIHSIYIINMYKYKNEFSKQKLFVLDK